MTQPTPGDVHIDAALTDFSVAYIQDDTNFVARQALPIKPVSKATNKFFIFAKNDWLRDDAVKMRAPGEAAPRSGFTLSTDSYSCDVWWTSVPLSDMTVRNADPSLPLDQACTRLVSQRMLIRLERQFGSKMFATSKWGTDKVGTTDFTKWSDYSSDPVKDIDDGQTTVLTATGKEPNTLVVGYKVHKALKRHPIVKDMYKYTSSESITPEMIARALDLDKYIVAKSSYATNAEAAAAAYSFALGDNALLLWSDGNPSIMEPCAGAIFAWTDLTAFNTAGVAIDQYYDQNTKDDIVRGQFAFDIHITGSDLGYFFSAAV